MSNTTRQYTLDEAATELHIAPQTITRLLPKLGIDLSKQNQHLSEDDVNRILSAMNDDPDTAASDTH